MIEQIFEGNYNNTLAFKVNKITLLGLGTFKTIVFAL